MLKRIAFAVIGLFVLALPLALASNPEATIAYDSSVSCGQVVWATSCSGGFMYPIFLECFSDYPHLWQPPSFTPGAFYRCRPSRHRGKTGVINLGLNHHHIVESQATARFEIV